MMVDWNTVVVYTCSSGKCYPEGGNGYLRDFVFIQFSDDFSRVQLGDEKEMKKQEQTKKADAEKLGAAE